VDDTEQQARAHGCTFVPVRPGTIPVGKNNRYIKGIIAELLVQYECVLFAESPDDIIVPGPSHGHNLRAYLDDFLKSEDTYRFLSGINIVQGPNEPSYDPLKGTLLSQRQYAIRCNQYDNAFLWKTTPLWGKGWHDLGGKRLCGMGDLQGESKRLYNLHIHYADFDLANRRHHFRQRTFNDEQKRAYMCRVDDDLRGAMTEMILKPSHWFSEGNVVPIERWMQDVI
jgi:hypothetical protein